MLFIIWADSENILTVMVEIFKNEYNSFLYFNTIFVIIISHLPNGNVYSTKPPFMFNMLLYVTFIALLK